MIDSIHATLLREIEAHRGDFLLSTKQENYLSYAIASELSHGSAEVLYPTQWNRFDIVELHHPDLVPSKIIEAKYHYSSDFSQISEYGFQCAQKDARKLAGLDKFDSAEKYLMQFVVHLRLDQVEVWKEHFRNGISGFHQGSKYFTYLHGGASGRFRHDLMFRCTQRSLFEPEFEEVFIDEFSTFGLGAVSKGSCRFDLNAATVVFNGVEFAIPHEFYCFLWRLESTVR